MPRQSSYDDLYKKIIDLESKIDKIEKQCLDYQLHIHFNWIAKVLII